MRWMLALCAALVVAASASASNQAGPSWNSASRWLQTCNDEQSSYVGACVPDPLQCTWGDEDDTADDAVGKLSAGTTTSDTLCLVTDSCTDFACPHYIDAYAIGGSGSALTVTLTSDRGDIVNVPYVRADRRYEVCFSDPHFTGTRAPGDYPPLPEPFNPIPDAINPSYGYLTFWTLTVTASKTVQFSGGLEIAQNNADGRYLYWHTFNVPCTWATP